MGRALLKAYVPNTWRLRTVEVRGGVDDLGLRLSGSRHAEP